MAKIGKWFHEEILGTFAKMCVNMALHGNSNLSFAIWQIKQIK
jgi:hypothetical protein